MNVIAPLIEFQQQLRLFHWQTPSYSGHKAFGKAYETFDDLIDTFIETYMGIFGRSKPNTVFTINLQPLKNEETVNVVFDNFEFYLKEMSEEIPEHSDLLNIRDEMLGELHKLKYLLSLQ
jgi:hypothetical protein